MDIKKYTNANKEAWNEVMPKHQKASKEELDKLFSTPGAAVQNDSDLLDFYKKIDVKGKDIAHLSCNNGIELLSVKNMGASRCVGFDISDLAIAEGKERAKKFNIDCEFVCSDVYEIPEEYYNSFDLIQITSGCIGWLPDLNLFFSIACKLLRPRGSFLIHEIHPFSELLPFDDNEIENRLQLVDAYFNDGPIVENSSLDYIGNTDYEAKTQYWFIHTLSKIVMALSQNDFTIEEFIESPKDISAGHARIESLNAKIPLSLLILGTKKSD